MNDYLQDSTILVTGGTGSFGKKFLEMICKRYKPKKVIVFSRDEYKQHEMAVSLERNGVKARFFIGDVRDKSRLERAFENVDYVIHAAALKQVPALEYNPMEAVKTNILGASNIVDVAIDRGVKRVIALSTDKAVNPVNLYGATKLVSEKIFIDANAYGGNRTKFSVVRYGNVMASRGSVVEVFSKLKQQNIKEFPITDERMTRFWMTLNQSVGFVLKALREAEGGEVFVPNIPSMKLVELARAIEPECKFKIIGIRSGEKLHETLISEDESRNVKNYDGMYVILPQFYERQEVHNKYSKCESVPEGFVYRSDVNDKWLTAGEIKGILEDLA